MPIYTWLIVALWSILVAYWAISARSSKPSLGVGRQWWRAIGLRLALMLLVLLALRVPIVGQLLREMGLRGIERNPVAGAVGVVLCALGVGLAIWARAHLGRNWGMPMSRKESPELVTTGPYAFVRHPIYGGMLLAMLGSAIGQSLFWLVPLVLSGVYFIYSAHREEQLMNEQFPQSYPAYMHHTKMLLPFVL